MSLALLGWIFTLGALAHNAEEARWLPVWSARAGKWYPPMDARVFRLAAGMLSILFVAVTLAATFAAAGSIAAYLMAGYVLAIVLNVLMPHVLASVAMSRYMPGTATALAFNLPLGLLYLHRALVERAIAWPTFRWAGPLVVLTMLALLPMLFALARRLRRIAA